MTLTTRPDRRHRRREDTLTELLDVALELMEEHGAGGLTLGDLARRMGMKTPSLYVYFPSKHALYDAIFARGWVEVGTVVRGELERIDPSADLAQRLDAMGTPFVRWSVEHPAYSQLMAWRPVPGYEPSEAAYAPAVAVIQEATRAFARLQVAGLLRSDVPVAELVRTWTVLTGGVISQQLANAPHESFADGTFTRLLPDIFRMYQWRYATPAHRPD